MVMKTASLKSLRRLERELRGLPDLASARRPSRGLSSKWKRRRKSTRQPSNPRSDFEGSRDEGEGLAWTLQYSDSDWELKPSQPLKAEHVRFRHRRPVTLGFLGQIIEPGVKADRRRRTGCKRTRAPRRRTGPRRSRSCSRCSPPPPSSHCRTAHRQRDTFASAAASHHLTVATSPAGNRGGGGRQPQETEQVDQPPQVVHVGPEHCGRGSEQALTWMNSPMQAR